MPSHPDYLAALARLMELSYPPTTLKVAPARAVGHRLARSVVAKGNQPARPLALADGLAVLERDVLAGGRQAAWELDEAAAAQPLNLGNGAVEMAPELEADAALEPEGAPDADAVLEDDAAAALLDADAEPAGPVPARAVAAPDESVPADDRALAGDEAYPYDDAEPGLEPPGAAPGTLGQAQLELRPPPQSNRREDALQPGQAIPVNVGAEVPRGAELVYPFAWLYPAPEWQPPQRRERPAGEDSTDEEGLPAAEPPRDWDLPTQHLQGSAALPLLPPGAPCHITPIGGWARNREVVLPERTVVRAGELALLEALEVDEVEVYRRPVLGIASLAPPFPSPQHAAEDEHGTPQGACPLITLCVELARSARVAALPLGHAPRRFRPLVAALERWVQQVDIMLLVGGTHHGPGCLGLDALAAAGKVQFAGVDLEPGGGLSAGTVSERPVLVIPGTLPDVLAAFVLFARPLAHKYLQPANYRDTVELVLEHGSRIRPQQPLALPVRYGFDAERGRLATRFGGRVHDPWLDYIRGQALLIAAPDQPFADGETALAYAY